MILESYLSKEQNLLSQEEYHEIKYNINELFERISFSNEAIETIIELLHFDKKNAFGRVQFVLLENIGQATINQVVDKTLIYKAFNDYLC